MGTYTEFKCKFRLKKDTPEEIITFLKKTMVDGDIGLDDKTVIIPGQVPRPNINHEFFDCDRWYSLFHCRNWSPEQFSGSKFYEESGYPTIEIHTEFKNYDSEIDKFIDWISPHIVGRKKKQYLGYWRQEEMDHQFNIYLERPSPPEMITPKTDEQKVAEYNAANFPDSMMSITNMSEADFKDKYPHIAMLFEKKRRGRPRINIKEPSDLECIISDMFDEFMEDLVEKPWATRELNADEKEDPDYDGFQYIYTRRGQQITETYIRRMGELWTKVFPDEEELDLKSTYFREP